MSYKTDINFRAASLKKLLYHLSKNENAIIKALHDDFKKPAFEAVLTETSYVISDLKHTISNINSWARPKWVLPSLLNFPSQDFIYSEPYGKVLIIAPWNYPFQLALCPLIAAVAAGNQVVVKPSELTPHTSAIISKIVSEVFKKEHVEVVQGDAAVAQQLLSQRWDYIFFTGSVPVGKIVAKAAAEWMTPVTLELGGKNPCIIDATADLKLAAKRIVWGKFVNAGQTCIAPDYLLVHQKVKAALIPFLIAEIQLAYGENPQNSTDFCRIINRKNCQRLADLIKRTTVIFGGTTDIDDCYIAPTLIDESDLQSAIMKEEIFGPILPIVAYDNDADLSKIILQHEKPLSLYIFTTNTAAAKKTIQDFSFGGGCINDTMVHFVNKRLPFGGVGHSGIGAYHGRFGFVTFSHQKAITKKANWLDLPLRYAPYKDKLKWMQKLLNRL